MGQDGEVESSPLPSDPLKEHVEALLPMAGTSHFQVCPERLQGTCPIRALPTSTFRPPEKAEGSSNSWAEKGNKRNEERGAVGQESREGRRGGSQGCLWAGPAVSWGSQPPVRASSFYWLQLQHTAIKWWRILRWWPESIKPQTQGPPEPEALCHHTGLTCRKPTLSINESDVCSSGRGELSITVLLSMSLKHFHPKNDGYLTQNPHV